MKKLEACKNCLRFLDLIKNPSRGNYTLVTNYVEHDDFLHYRLKFTPEKLVKYMQQLLSALDSMHSIGIIHRDIKP